MPLWPVPARQKDCPHTLSGSFMLCVVPTYLFLGVLCTFLTRHYLDREHILINFSSAFFIYPPCYFLVFYYLLLLYIFLIQYFHSSLDVGNSFFLISFHPSLPRDGLVMEYKFYLNCTHTFCR